MTPALRIPGRLSGLAMLCGLGGLVGVGELHAQQLRTLTHSRQATDERHIEARVAWGAGRLKIKRGAPRLLYRARIRFDERFATPTAEYRNGSLEVDLGLEKGWDPGDGDPPTIELELSRDVPTDLHLDFFAGTAELDLTGVPLERLLLNNAASETELRVSAANPVRMDSAKIHVGVADFEAHGLGHLNSSRVEVKAVLGAVTIGLDGDWPRDARLSIEMGLGALEILVPETLGVRVRHESNLLAAIEAEGFERRRDVYTSHNWNRAERRLDLELSTTIGAVEFVWIP